MWRTSASLLSQEELRAWCTDQTGCDRFSCADGGMIMGNTFGQAKAGDSDRRAFLQAAVAVATIAAIGESHGNLAHAAALTRAQRDQMTAEQIIAVMKRGNERFRTGKEKPHNYLAQQKASAPG